MMARFYHLVHLRMRAASHDPDLAAAIDQRLPQTQCAQCDYPGCLAYARAIADGEADINQCPPGGAVTIDALARLLGREPKPLNPKHRAKHAAPLQLAFIREADCIGCKRCITACPVDCIIGAAKLMHTVIATECSGCQLCLPVCPTDCITLADPPTDYAAGAPSIWREFSAQQVDKARRRARHKRERQSELERARTNERRERHRGKLKKEIIAAVARKQSAANQWATGGNRRRE